MSEPVAICAPAGRDDIVVREILLSAGIKSRIVRPAMLVTGIERSDYSAVLLTEEAVNLLPADPMRVALAGQPLWSDLPFVVLGSKGLAESKLAATQALLGNVVQVERPVHRVALIDLIKNVLRARDRQMDARRYLEEREIAERKLQEAAAGLEQIVEDRTRILLTTGKRLLVQLEERIADHEHMRQMQAELIHISRVSAMGTMASTLAHELNQPLTSALNYLRGSLRLLLAGGGQIAPEALNGLENAVQSAHRAGELVRRLREFVSRGHIDRRPEDLPKLIEEAVAVGLVDARAQGVTITIRLDPLAPVILADRVQIQQVLINLLRNAIDAMAATTPREITISTRYIRQNEMVEVSVRDTGPGMTDEEIATLFSPFTTSKSGGMGMGLSISRTIVEANGGVIVGGNRDDGGGAEFRFTASSGRIGDGAPPGPVVASAISRTTQ